MNFESKKLLCPICRKEIDKNENTFFPFCSKRCKNVDLGTWFKEEYKIPGEEIRIEDISNIDVEMKEQ